MKAAKRTMYDKCDAHRRKQRKDNMLLIYNVKFVVFYLLHCQKGCVDRPMIYEEYSILSAEVNNNRILKVHRLPIIGLRLLLYE